MKKLILLFFALMYAATMFGQIIKVSIDDGRNKKNGEVWNPNGIEMIYVEGTDNIINSFFIGKYEVTQAQWESVMGNNPSYSKGANHPVENVSWNDVQEFIKKLNAMTGHNYRLPSEAEWEYAAREGKKQSTYEFSGSNYAYEVAWCRGSYYIFSIYGHHYRQYTTTHRYSEVTTRPVGQKEANSLGIYDMTGNVWEWCEDYYDKLCNYHVMRGGSWSSLDKHCNIFYRDRNTPYSRNNICGFRLAANALLP